MDQAETCRVTEKPRAEKSISWSVASVPQAITAFLSQWPDLDYYVYERESVWYLGLGTQAVLTIGASGEQASIETENGCQFLASRQPLASYARQFIRRFARPGERIYGQAGFHYAAHVRGIDFCPGQWPLLRLVMPRHELIFSQEGVRIRSESDAQCDIFGALLQEIPADFPALYDDWQVETGGEQQEYERQVADAIDDIRAGLYSKIILSRALALEKTIDMAATYCRGRAANTPVRSFLLRNSHQQAVGFCPELVMSVRHGRVVTEPLAGTRALVGSEAQKRRYRDELQHDHKEVVEHIQSVKAAIDELQSVCEVASIAVNDLMTVRERGSVQHLGSTVSGQLREGNDVWDAFHALFPAITASGIAKDPVLKAIMQYESTARELYSGAILWLDGTEHFEAALVLRSAYQDEQRQWIQAGAGIIEPSIPAREWVETQEKLASVAPYLVAQARSTDLSH